MNSEQLNRVNELVNYAKIIEEDIWSYNDGIERYTRKKNDLVLFRDRLKAELKELGYEE